MYKMEKPHAHKSQLTEMQKLYAEYKSAMDNKLSDNEVDVSRIAFYDVCDKYDWMDYVVEDNGSEMLMNVRDEVLVPPIYQRLACCQGRVNSREFPIAAMSNGKWGLVMPDGCGTPVGKFDYDDIESVDRFFVVGKPEGKGVLDSRGRLLVPCIMDEIIFRPIFLAGDVEHSWYDDCMFELCKGNRVGVLTMDGIYVKPSYDEILFSEIVDADEALGAVLDGVDGCVAVDGRLVPDEDFEANEDSLVYTKGRYSHRSSYDYELDVKMGYAEGRI